MNRVERSVLPQNSDAMAFRASFLVDLQMLAVTGALIAQVAITSISLPNLDTVHWAAKAGFVVSLVFAGLSVWISTTVARLLNSRDDPMLLRDWLSTPANHSARSKFGKTFENRFKTANIASCEEVGELRQEIAGFLRDHKWETASLYTCTLLSAPSQLLNFSLAALLVALGVYLGETWKQEVDPAAGNTASRAVFISYLTALSCGLGLFFGASTGKDRETGKIKRWIAMLENIPVEQGGLTRREEDVEARKHREDEEHTQQ
jgi:hypothetical protein